MLQSALPGGGFVFWVLFFVFVFGQWQLHHHFCTVGVPVDKLHAAAVLRRYGLTPQPADNGCLLPTMEDARLAALVQDLAAEGAGVVGVERQTKNLEEIFLSLTNTQTGKEVG